jgi:CRP-like cAMP-binding protein
MASRRENIRIENHLLAALPEDELERLLPHLEVVRLTRNRIVFLSGEPLRHAYFPNSGSISLLAINENGASIELCMVGNEGVVGVPIVLRINKMPYQAITQVPTDALRVRRAVLAEELDRGGWLQTLMLRYTQVLLTYFGQAAVCNHFHPIEKRLCRWLLMAHDRTKSDTLPITQEMISQLLGIPRTGVTMAAGELQKAGLIHYSRGKIIIFNRRELESSACECYRILRDEFDQFLKVA